MSQLVLMELLSKINQHPSSPLPPLQRLGALQNDNDYSEYDTEQKKFTKSVFFCRLFKKCITNLVSVLPATVFHFSGLSFFRPWFL